MIYAIRAVGTGFIKFGKANSVGRRLTELETGSPHELEIAAVADWPDSAESALHRVLVKSFHRREWFKETPETAQAILWMQSPQGLQSLREAATQLGWKDRQEIKEARARVSLARARESVAPCYPAFDLQAWREERKRRVA